MITRMEELYSAIKNKSIVLKPIEGKELIDSALNKVYKKYPEAILNVDISDKVVILGDINHLSEAVYNLIINAWEATIIASKTTPVVVTVTEDKIGTMINIKDNGIGIKKEDQSKIFDPFFSNKNRNYNWGMGLYYVRSIVKNHMGFLKYDTDYNTTTFSIILLRYSNIKKDKLYSCWQCCR